MKLVVAGLFFTTTLVGLGCSPRPELKKVDWESGSYLPHFPYDLSQSSLKSQFKENKISFSKQEFNGVLIRDSFVKTVYQKNDSPLFLRAQFLENIPTGASRRIQKIKDQLPELRTLLTKSVGEKYKSIIEPVDVELDSEAQVILYAIVSDSLGEYYKISWDSDLRLLSEERVGSRFHDGVGWVFPDSPLRSQVTDVTIKELSGDGTLSGRSVNVTTEAPQRAQSEELYFKFPIQDEKFDQVQAYHHIHRSLDWFYEQMGWSLHQPLKVVLSVGYPLKTNTAFYYQGQIRIGSGDDVVYSRIPLDPSIIIHETAHALIDNVAKLPHQGEGGSVNEAFADFFTASFLNSPRMAEYSYKRAEFKRTLDNEKVMSDKKGALYADSLIISGTFWEIRQKLNPEKAINFAEQILMRLSPATDFTDLQKQAKEVLLELPEEDKKQIELILIKRGWSL